MLDGSEGPCLPIFNPINLDREFFQKYLDPMVPLDPCNQYWVSHPKPPIVHDGLLVTEQEKDRHRTSTGITATATPAFA
ncbi:MAG TPA: hypothetical protein VNN13_11705 [Methylomirabilota bacterium]|nr:hypothetical protein [Methylomirabilota bacterium]